MEKNNYTKEEVLQLMYQAFESGFKKYEVVDAGLESMETKEECGWILRRYDSDLAKETQKQLIIEIMNEDAKDGLYKKQTAVEWLMEQITYKTDDGERRNAFIDTVDLSEYFNQAKEMEKQQIMDAWDDGNDNEIRGGKYRRIIREKYYNEEYGKQTTNSSK